MYSLPMLSFAYGDLEPYIDAKTMEIHYTKHHLTYINNLNSVFETHRELEDVSLDYLLTNLYNLPAEIQTIVRNNGGGHWNHTFFWSILGPNGSKEPNGYLMEEIKQAFGSFVDFKVKFKEVAMQRFGSGWAWLVRNKDGLLEIYSTPNQDCPITEGKVPIIGLDVWEHAYYLKYQNRRSDYIDAFWNVLDWSKVS
ncbi:MAG: superoxide dismutase [Candidatus Dojkabacteria bacterium]|nr:superoxide dismutase [Candidatus Dojkabacteria bacterium]